MGQVNGCLVDDRGTWTVSCPDDDSKSIQLLVKGSGNQKTVAVTGANGFIGSHIVNLLLRKGYKVRGTVLQHKPALVDFLMDLPNAAKNLTLHEKEIVDGCFDNVFQGCDCVFHTASPTLKDQRDMKEPQVEMIETARSGMSNVFQSCKKNGVGTLVFTSSLCSAVPKTNAPSGGLPAVIYEKHWAHPDFLRKKGSHYAASKTLAEIDAVKMAEDSSIRLVRICPSFTVGPMLQPTVNSSMERFARICAGLHHKRIPNRSISLVDVRDVAAHHVAAYEKGVEGRFFSTTESWYWTLVYNALQILIPHKNWPPLPNGKHLRPRKFCTSKMKTLGVTERTFMQVLTDAVEEIKNTDIYHGLVQCHEVSLLPTRLINSFRIHAGYYASVKLDGTFFMIEVIAWYEPNKNVSYSVYLSWFFPGSGREVPMCIQVMQISNASFDNGELLLDVYKISLTFKSIYLGSRSYWTVQGSIEGNEIDAVSYVLPLPADDFARTYTAIDGKHVRIDLGDKFSTIANYNSTITDYNNYQTSKFSYNTTKRVFEYQTGNGDDTMTHQLFLNAAAGNGLRLTFVEFYPYKLPDGKSSTKNFFLSPNFTTTGSKPPTGAEDLAAFVGYYQFQNYSFVSVVETLERSSNATVSVTIFDGSNSIEYTSFNFDKSSGTLTLPNSLTLKFQSKFASYSDNSSIISERLITTVTWDQDTARNYFAPAPLLSAFGNYILTGTDFDLNEYSLQISNTDNGLSISFTKNGQNVFEPTVIYVYNTVEQCAKVGEYVFNLTYEADKGIGCGVTTVNAFGEPTGLVVALYAFPSVTLPLEIKAASRPACTRINY